MANIYKLNYTASQVDEAIGNALSAVQPNQPVNFTDGIQKNGVAVLNANEISNPNLLINGDFRINQRGQTTYTGIVGYCVDRWGTYASNTVTVVDNGIEFSSSTTTYAQIYQYLEIAPSWAEGKIVTLSASINGEIYTVTGTMSTDMGLSMNLTVPNLGSLTLRYGSSKSAYFVGIFNVYSVNPSGQTNTINWVKLELGSVATAFSPRPYAEELALCQRYYQRYNFAFNMPLPMGVGRSSSVISLNFLIPKLRVNTPTFTTSGTVKMLNTPSTTGLSLTLNQYYDGMVRLFINTSATEGEGYSFAGENDGYYAFDAEM